MAHAAGLSARLSVGRPGGRLRLLGLRALHVFVLTSLSIALPAFLVAGAHFFITRGSDEAADVLTAVAVIGLGPPVVLVALDALAELINPRLGTAVHLVVVGFLAALFASQLLFPTDLGLELHLILAALLGAAASVAYARTGGFRSFITALAPVPLLALAYLLLLSPVSRLVIGGEEAASAASTHSRTPVVVVVFDELPGYALMGSSGRIDATRFPAFGRLARDSTWYRNATTSRSDTELAVPTLVSGRYAPVDTLPIAADHPRSLFTLLAESHRMHVSEPWTDLCPHRLCAGGTKSTIEGDRGSLLEAIPVLLGHVYLPDPRRLGIPSPRESSALSRPGQVRTFIEEIERETAPKLHFLHVLLPHKAWSYLPSGRRYDDHVGARSPLAGLDQLSEDPWPALQFRQRFLMQLRFTDRLLGELLDRLRETGLYDRSLIVVAADHGVSFNAGDARRDVTDTNAQDIFSIPLFVKLPRQERGEVDDRPARSVDVVPTIADALGMRLPWPVGGLSLLGTIPPDRSPRVENKTGAVVELSPREFAERRDAALRVQIEEFGEGSDGLMVIGPRRDLLGQRTAALAGEPADAEATVIDGRSVRSYDPGATHVPARIAGTLDGLDPKRALAVALDGRVVATTYSYQGDGAVEFSAIVPLRELQTGSNRLSILEIAGTGEGTQLRPLEVGY